MKVLANPFWKKIIYFGKNYFLNFFKNLNISKVKTIDLSTFNVVLYSKGSRNNMCYKLEDIIYDFALISSLSPEEASYIGYYYGCNYTKFGLLKKHNYNFLINTSISNKYNLLAIDRKKNIIFSASNSTQNHSMSPDEIFNSKHILRGFSSTTACYLGLLAGLNVKAN